MTAAFVPPGKQTFVNSAGEPLVGGWVWHYIPGTDTLKDTWQDYDQAAFNTNPIELDERGQCIIYGTGNYRQRLTEADGSEIWDQNVTVGEQGPVSLAWGAIFGMSTGNASGVSPTLISITVGQCRDSTNTEDIVFTLPITKDITQTFVAGGFGGRDTADALLVNQSWHIFAIKNVDSGAVDALFSQSATNPVMPNGYTKFRRLASLPRLGGSSSPPAGTGIPIYTQTGDIFELYAANNEYQAQSGSSAALLRTMLTPLGIKVNAILYGQCTLSPNTGVRMRVTNPAPGVPPPLSGAQQFAQIRLDVNETYNACVFYAVTSTAAQLYIQVSDATAIWALKSIGWIDQRQLVS